MGINLTTDEQLEIMRKQLANFDDLWDKMRYMKMAFDADPEFTKEARDIIRGEIAREMTHEN